MEDNKIFLGQCGCSDISEYYFDKENNCFIKERRYPDYHDDMHYDEPSVVTAQQIYDDFVECMYTKGIEKLLEYCDEEQIEKTSDRGISEEQFRKRLGYIAEIPSCGPVKTGGTYTLYDKQKNMLCTIHETEYFYEYTGSRLSGESKGFKTLNEAFSYAAEQVNKYYIYNYKTEENKAKPKGNKRISGRKKAVIFAVSLIVLLISLVIVFFKP